MKKLAEQVKALEQNERIKRESAADIENFFDLCLKKGDYERVSNTLKSLDPEDFPRYNHYQALLDLATASVA